MTNYKSQLSATINKKGVLDIDSVKGCSSGMAKYPKGGCYNLCYAAKIAKRCGYDFTNSVSRAISNKNNKQLRLYDQFYDIYGGKNTFEIVEKHKLNWFRIGTMGDPCHDWQLTYDLCEWLYRLKVPVVVTKHWATISDELLFKLKGKNIVFNTSISALDTIDEISHRLYQFKRIKKVGIKSVLRIVSCKFGNTETGQRLNKIQEGLFKNKPIIDNPLRIPFSDRRVVGGHITTKRVKDLRGYASVSIFNNDTYIGECSFCPDQCGTN
jgi:hypothetical protein